MSEGHGNLDRGSTPLLRVEHLTKTYRAARGRRVAAVRDVSFEVLAGETLGVVGESGSGKSTTSRSIMMLPPPTSGRVVFDGVELTTIGVRGMRALRPRMQMVFQDPSSSLNPRRTVRALVGEGLDRVLPKRAVDERVDEVLDAVGLSAERYGRRHPHQLSGGQCQRVAIARALARRPQLLICDEAVSALDVSVQAQILNLLEDMKDRYGLTMLFISHDLAVVRGVSDRIAVMYQGTVCEIAPAEQIYREAAHPYTRQLIDAIPIVDLDRDRTAAPVAGDVTMSPVAERGCPYRGRCPNATERCTIDQPELRELAAGRHVACHHPIGRSDR